MRELIAGIFVGACVVLIAGLVPYIRWARRDRKAWQELVKTRQEALNDWNQAIAANEKAVERLKQAQQLLADAERLSEGGK